MNETRGAQPDGTGATEDVQRLHDRIRELEQQLVSRSEPAYNAGNGHSSGGGLKFLTAALAALGLAMALPAFITVRRWWDWWR